jgi:hypothetical protein
MHHDGDQRQNGPSRAGCTLPMLCRVAGTWNKQGDDHVGWALGISTTLGSDVT